MTKPIFERTPDGIVLACILGEPLSGVWFVMDYLQLQFNSIVITCLVWPRVVTADRAWAFGDPGYRDALCGSIAKPVRGAVVRPGASMTIDLGDTKLELDMSAERVETVVLNELCGANLAVW